MTTLICLIVVIITQIICYTIYTLNHIKLLKKYEQSYRNLYNEVIYSFKWIDTNLVNIESKIDNLISKTKS